MRNLHSHQWQNLDLNPKTYILPTKPCVISRFGSKSCAVPLEWHFLEKIKHKNTTAIGITSLPLQIYWANAVPWCYLALCHHPSQVWTGCFSPLLGDSGNLREPIGGTLWRVKVINNYLLDVYCIWISSRLWKFHLFPRKSIIILAGWKHYMSSKDKKAMRKHTYKKR